MTERVSKHCAGLRDFVEKLFGWVEKNAARVAVPRGDDALLDGQGFFGGLDAQRVLVVVMIGRRRAKVKHEGIASELGFARRSHRAEERVGVPRPIRHAIEGSAVAKNESRGSFFEGEPLELALNREDRSLSGASPHVAAFAWESSAEDDSRRLRQDVDVLGRVALDDLEDRGLPRSLVRSSPPPTGCLTHTSPLALGLAFRARP